MWYGKKNHCLKTREANRVTREVAAILGDRPKTGLRHEVKEMAFRWRGEKEEQVLRRIEGHEGWNQNRKQLQG